ncbi:PREDICTED: C-type lectin domain family 3 member A-like [Branchiostoma belcheri]|uniref:C-type lectin domain family 3 member A-like n=1 Tax=Branchiostoma belcheri TaxID=7741 RepID=A0A6P5AC38_BRABE|nr:PREDICTED: C-type lectin domain family 3 member A-like [Branchiostoma belcheri]
MYEQAEPVRSPFSGPDSRQSSNPPPQPRPVRQSGSRGRVRHGNGASDKQRPREDQDTSSHTYENAEEAKRYATSADRAYPGGASGRCGVCSFLRARRSCQAAGIAVLLGLVAVGLAPLTFSNKQEISQLSTTVDALKRDLDNERNRAAALEQRLHEIEKTLPSCPEGYTIGRGICYKACNTLKTFSEADATCRVDGGTLAMPRDADTNDFLVSLYKPVNDHTSFWFGLHDQREEGRFEWVDGSALGPYNSWAPKEPNDAGSGEDCAVYSAKLKHKWNDQPCHFQLYFICQAAPGNSCIFAIP